MKIQLLSIIFFCSALGYGQAPVNLMQLMEEGNIEVINRQLNAYGNDAVTLNAQGGEGLALLQTVGCETGRITLELKGENKPGQSFIGLAFNVQDPNHYEAIYFRPFNFVAAAPERKKHMVQYLYHPSYTWRKLREERTDEFEAEIKNPPHPEQWFTAKLQIMPTEVLVFIDDDPAPVMRVQRLATFHSDRIALWVGNGSSGRFRNLVLSNDHLPNK